VSASPPGLLGVGSVFGLVAYVAHSHRREFAVRLALGASTRRIVWPAMRTAMQPVGIGAAAGIVAAILLSGTIESYLLGIPAVHASTYAAVLVHFGLSAAIAGWLAARRLRRFAPIEALRTE
jgi:ABC-type antimicrobial peptide transport system permease subunit